MVTPVSTIEDVLSGAPSCSNFLSFLQQNYQAEYLEFWLLAEKFKHTDEVSDRKVLGSKMFDLYFNESSPRCLAIDRAFTEGLEVELSLARTELFVKSQRAAYIQLRQSFSSYMNSDVYKKFLAKSHDQKCRPSLPPSALPRFPSGLSSLCLLYSLNSCCSLRFAPSVPFRTPRRYKQARAPVADVALLTWMSCADHLRSRR